MAARVPAKRGQCGTSRHCPLQEKAAKLGTAPPPATNRGVSTVSTVHLRIAHKLQRKTCAGETIFQTLPVNHHRIITANWSRGRHGCGSVANVARRIWASWSAYKHVLCGFATPTDPLNSAFGLPLQACPVWLALGALHPPFRSAMCD